MNGSKQNTVISFVITTVNKCYGDQFEDEMRGTLTLCGPNGFL
jgi:hypothetical protein